MTELEAHAATASSHWRRMPFSRRVLIDPEAGRTARHIRALTGGSDWRRNLVDRAGAAVLAVGGSRAMPSATQPLWPTSDIRALSSALRSELPGMRLLGAVVPRQPGRTRLSILARTTGNLTVVKLGTDDDQLHREAHALRLLERDPLPGIATPVAIGVGTFELDQGAVTYLATTSIALTRQHPAIDEPLRTFERDLAERLAELPRPAGPGAGGAHGGDTLVPIHGDLTPWNLRRTSRGLALFDWEEAGWGEPGSDLQTYRAACDDVRPWWKARN